MDEWRRIFGRDGGLFHPRRDITRRQLLALGLVLDSAVTLGCVSLGGLNPEIAFVGWVGSLLIILLFGVVSRA